MGPNSQESNAVPWTSCRITVSGCFALHGSLGKTTEATAEYCVIGNWHEVKSAKKTYKEEYKDGVA